MIKPGRHTFRRGGFLARHGIASSPAKVRVSFDIDVDILNYFRQHASDADSYQTEINDILRELIKTEKNDASSAFSLQTEALLADRRFIEAVARRVRDAATHTHELKTKTPKPAV